MTSSKKSLCMTFPIRKISSGFTPAEGGNGGEFTSTPKGLCVMEALHWAQGADIAKDSPPCVSPSFRNLFIKLNDGYGNSMRRALFKRVHRLIGTDHIPSSVTFCLAEKVSSMVGNREHSVLRKLDTVLNSLDAWCEENDPALAALRREVPPLFALTKPRSSLLSRLQQLSRKPFSSRSLLSRISLVKKGL